MLNVCNLKNKNKKTPSFFKHYLNDEDINNTVISLLFASLKNLNLHEMWFLKLGTEKKKKE